MRRVVWSERAVADLMALNDWLTDKQTSREAADTLRAIRAQTARLDDFPAIGSLQPGGLRKLAIKGYPFVMLYEFSGGKLTVIRLVHNRSDWQGLA